MYIVAKCSDTWWQLPHHIKRDIKIKVVKKYGYVCTKAHGHGCGRALLWHEITMDHIIPISRGGSVCDVTNIQPLCKKCHDKKTAKDESIGFSYVKEKPSIGDFLKCDPFDLYDPPLP